MKLHLPFSFSLSPKKRFLFSFAGGLLIGIIYGGFFAKTYMEQVGFLSDYFLVHYLKNEIDGNQLFPYLLKGRGASLFVLWTLGSSFLGGFLIYLALLWVGFSTGIYLIAGIMKNGLAGLGFCIAAFFPQALFYLPAFGLVLIQAYVTARRQEVGRERAVRYFAVLLVSFLLLFLGVLTESYVNPSILKKLLKNF